MNKRKRTAHRRAALWPRRIPLACPDDGLNFKRLFPDRWEEMVDALRAHYATLTIATDDGTAQARFRADMARAQADGLVWHGSEGATVTVVPPGAERGEDRA